MNQIPTSTTTTQQQAQAAADALLKKRTNQTTTNGGGDNNNKEQAIAGTQAQQHPITRTVSRGKRWLFILVVFVYLILSKLIARSTGSSSSTAQK